MANQKINADKNQWRLRLKKIRQELSEDRKAQASLIACQELKQRCQHAQFVLSFASFGSEIDLWPLNQALAREGRLVLPLMAVNHHLELFQITHFNQLEKHSLGMLEPQASICNRIDPSLVEIALIPGLGFDLNTHYRLGYGKGYYDRLLAEALLKETCGVGFLEQGVENLPYTKHDMPLNQICLF